MHDLEATAGRARIRVGVVGASGYSGMELVRLLLAHPVFELGFLSSDRWQGDRLSRRMGLDASRATNETGADRLTYAPLDRSIDLANEVEAVLLATPAEASLDLVPALLERGRRVVDLSGAFRLRDASAYPRYYRFTHPSAALLGEALYGLPEIVRAQSSPARWREARLIANPGCYATAVALALAPLVVGELVDRGSLVVDAASGVTGAGRKASEPFSFGELDGDFRAYRLVGHQHTPEIAQTLGLEADQLPFVPHLLPVRRGILVTAHARLAPGVDPTAVRGRLGAAYADEPFVRLADDPEEVTLRAVVGSNLCALGLATTGRRAVVLAAIDNLLKGAAGQALQNLNLAFGLDETLGLTAGRGLGGQRP